MRIALKQLKGRLGCVVRDIERKTAEWSSLPDGLAYELALARRLPAQDAKSRNKFYSLHAPEVECISRGKAHKRYEFGAKSVLKCCGFESMRHTVSVVAEAWCSDSHYRILAPRHRMRAIDPNETFPLRTRHADIR